MCAVQWLEQAFEDAVRPPYRDPELLELKDDHDEPCWTCSEEDLTDSPEAMVWFPPDPDNWWYDEYDVVMRLWPSEETLPPPARSFTWGPEYPTRP
jgi:hypothetical protein